MFCASNPFALALPIKFCIGRPDFRFDHVYIDDLGLEWKAASFLFSCELMLTSSPRFFALKLKAFLISLNWPMRKSFMGNLTGLGVRKSPNAADCCENVNHFLECAK